MSSKFIAVFAVGFAAFASAPALAATLSEQVALCAAAVDDEGLAEIADYRANYVNSRGAASKRLTIELIPYDAGDVLTAECVIRRGEVTAVALKS